MDWSLLVEQYVAAMQAGEKSCWDRGDIALKIPKGERKDFAQKAKEEPRRLYALAHLAESYPPNERHLGVSFEHHYVVAAQTDRHKWLDEAERQGWSMHALRQELKDAIAARERARLELPPEVHVDMQTNGAEEAPLILDSAPPVEGTEPDAPINLQFIERHPKQEEVHVSSVSGRTKCPDCGFEFEFVEPLNQCEIRTDTFVRGAINDGSQDSPA